MAVLALVEIAGLDRERYQAALARLPAGPPVGRLWHAAGASAAGWQLHEVWTTADAFDALVDNYLLPALQAVGSAGALRRERLAAQQDVGVMADALRAPLVRALRSQFRAAPAMLSQVVAQCLALLWEAPAAGRPGPVGRLGVRLAADARAGTTTLQPAAPTIPRR